MCAGLWEFVGLGSNGWSTSISISVDFVCLNTITVNQSPVVETFFLVRRNAIIILIEWSEVRKEKQLHNLMNE